MIVLLAEIRGRIFRELVCSADSSWAIEREGLAKELDQISIDWEEEGSRLRTERKDHATTPGEDAERADVLPSCRILDAGREQTCGTGDHGALNAGLDSIYGMVVVIVTVGRHLRWGFGQGAGCRKDQLAQLGL